MGGQAVGMPPGGRVGMPPGSAAMPPVSSASDATPDGGPAVLVPTSSQAATSRRNYVLGVLNGAVGTVAYDFVHPDLILAGLVFLLAKQAYGEGWAYLLVACLSIINKGGSLLPQLYISSLLEHRPRKRPFYILLTLVRGAGAVSLVVALALMAQQVNAWSLGLFLAAFALVSVCMGAGYVITLDMWGRMINLDRIGSFLGTREFLGGALSLIAGLVVMQPILDRGKDAADAAAGGVPVWNYVWLGAIGTTLTVLAMIFMILCHEEPGPRARRRTTVGESLVRGWRWLKRNADYRAYLWLRIAFRINDLAFVFFIPYGQQKLTHSESAGGVAVLGGVMLAVFKISRVASSALWGWVVDTYGDRTCLIWTGVCFTLAPLLALAAPMMPTAFEVPMVVTDAVLDLPLAVYLTALVAIGTAFQGSIIGGNRFLIGRAPPRRRLSYIGFLNTVTSPLTFLPVAAAAVAGAWGVTALFAAITSGGVLYLYWAWRLRANV